MTERRRNPLNDTPIRKKAFRVVVVVSGILRSVSTNQQYSSIMTQASNGHGDNRPSSARRIGLREADAGSGSVPMVSNFFPIERYYDAVDKVRLRRDETILFFYPLDNEWFLTCASFLTPLFHLP
jgi:hypothetical protein